MQLVSCKNALNPTVVYSTDCSKAMARTLCCFLVYSTRRFVLCFSLCYFVLVFFSPFSVAITSLGEERANLSAFRTFVRFALVWFCLFPLPLGVWEGLRFVIMALPGLFSYLFFFMDFIYFTFMTLYSSCSFKKNKILFLFVPMLSTSSVLLLLPSRVSFLTNRHTKREPYVFRFVILQKRLRSPVFGLQTWVFCLKYPQGPYYMSANSKSSGKTELIFMCWLIYVSRIVLFHS